MADNANKENKDPGDGSSDYIVLKVIGNDTHEIHFRAKRTARLGKLKKKYSEKVGFPLSSLGFFFLEHLINDNETPQQLEMENGDVIEVQLYQLGNGNDVSDQSSFENIVNFMEILDHDHGYAYYEMNEP